MRKLSLLVLPLALVLLACGKRSQGPDEAREELLAKTQALLDGITHGDKKVFQDTLDRAGGPAGQQRPGLAAGMTGA